MARDEVLLNLLTKDSKRQQAEQEQQQQQKRLQEQLERQLELEPGELQEHTEQPQPALFGLASNLESSLNYAQLLLTLITQIDETVLVFLIVMLICGIVYACEYATHAHTHAHLRI